MTTEIYTAIIFEEDFLTAKIEYQIEVYAKLIQAYRPYFSQGEPDEEPYFDIIEVYCNGKKTDIETLAPMLYWNGERMTETKLIEKLVNAINEQ